MAQTDEVRAVRFYFDFISPYAYLAWTQIYAVAERADHVVEPAPVLFAGLLDAHGTKGPAEVPAKRAYIFKDAYRTAKLLGVPFEPPPFHPFNPLAALRVVSTPIAARVQKSLIDALFHATWGGGGGVTKAEDVARVVASVGIDAEEAMRQASSQEIKDTVRRRTEEAVGLGIFGVPTMLVRGEIFWGVDALAHAERRMRGEDPITPEIVARYSHIVPSAVRPGSRPKTD